MVYVDEIDVDQEGIAEMILDENAIAQVPRKLSKWNAIRRKKSCVYKYIVRYCMFKKIHAAQWLKIAELE